MILVVRTPAPPGDEISFVYRALLGLIEVSPLKFQGVLEMAIVRLSFVDVSEGHYNGYVSKSAF